MDQYHDGYVDVPRGGQEMENGYYNGGRPRGYSINNDSRSTNTAATSTSNPTAPTLHHHNSSHSGTSGYSDSLAGGLGHGAGGAGSISLNSDTTAAMGLGSQRPSIAEQRLSSGPGSGKDTGDAVPVGFDEGILRGLCEMDGSLALLADRIKQSIASCKQVAIFFRSRAEIEEKYARSLVELGRTTGEVYARSDCKAGTFVTAWHSSIRLQDQIAQNRLRFSQRLVEMSDELLVLGREGEKLRKTHKENGARYQGILQESESVMDKAKARFDSTAEELERILVAKEGESLKDSGMRSSGSNSSTNTAGSGIGGGQGFSGIGNAGISGGSASGSGKKGGGLGKAMTKGLFKGKNPAQMQRQEDDIRARMASASEAFRKAVLECQALRQEYFNFQLPKILRLLKECADELDMGTQYHLSRYAFLYESTVLGEGTLLNPLGTEESPGLKAIFENIDNRSDFKSYMQNYAVARGTSRGPRREGPYDEGFLPPLPPHVQAGMQQGPTSTNGSLQTGGLGMATPGPGAISNTGGVGGLGGLSGMPTPMVPPSGGGPGGAGDFAIPGIPAASGATFGVDLTEQLARDGVEIPRVVEKCAQAIEAFGLESIGIYRLSGTTSKVQALKAALDKDVESTDVMADQWTSDINVVSGVLKLWFRELPEPLLTFELYHGFIEAARYENDRLRHIRLHEQVNELPDANYATLKYFMGHLDKVRRKEAINQMSVSNLSIVFGPTLLGAPPEEGGLNLEHMSFQCKAIETILDKYREIFVEEVEDDESGNGGFGAPGLGEDESGTVQ